MLAAFLDFLDSYIVEIVDSKLQLFFFFFFKFSEFYFFFLPYFTMTTKKIYGTHSTSKIQIPSLYSMVLTIFLPGEALGSVESSSTGEISSMSDEDVPEKDPDLELVPGSGLSNEQREDFNRVFLEMFLDSASCSQGADSNTPMENGLTIPQWWLLEWLRGQINHDEAQLAYLMGMEEEARQLNKLSSLLVRLRDLS